MSVTYNSRNFATGASLGGRFFTVIANAFATIAGWNDARATRVALSKLTDRELDDIGLNRSDIAKV